MRLLALGVLVASACGGGETYVVITVDARPAVHDADSLKVTLTNGGATLSNDLPLGDHTFPVTFSVSSPAATGDLTIGIAALGSDQSLIGQGTVMTALDAGTAQVTLEPADFVINTEYPMDQFLSDDFQATGTQIAAAPDGTWTAGFRDDCQSPCNMYARRFDKRGAPVSTTLGAGTNQFNVSTTLTDFFSEVTMASGSATTLAIWDSHDNSITPTLDGISCRPLDGSGNAPDFESDIVLEPQTEVVSAAALESGNFAVTWSSLNPGSGATNLVIRSVIVGPDCSPIGGPATLSSSTAADPRRSHVAANGSHVLYAWVDGGDLHVRAASTGNVLATGDLLLVPKTTTDTAEHVRITPMGDGFAVVVRFYSDTDGSAPGKIVLYQVTAAGALVGQPTLVTDKSASDFASSYSFSSAARADGALLVVWHACDVNGDGQGCGVFGRLFKPTGEAAGAAFGIPTTTLGDQTNPSVAALPDSFVVGWSDGSMAAPDISGLAARARIIYPSF